MSNFSFLNNIFSSFLSFSPYCIFAKNWYFNILQNFGGNSCICAIWNAISISESLISIGTEGSNFCFLTVGCAGKKSVFLDVSDYEEEEEFRRNEELTEFSWLMCVLNVAVSLSLLLRCFGLVSVSYCHFSRSSLVH